MSGEPRLLFCPPAFFTIDKAVDGVLGHGDFARRANALTLSDEESLSFAAWNAANTLLREAAELASRRAQDASQPGGGLSLAGLGRPVPPDDPLDRRTPEEWERLFNDAAETDEIRAISDKQEKAQALKKEAWDYLRSALYERQIDGYIYIVQVGQRMADPDFWLHPSVNSAYVNPIVRAPIDGKAATVEVRLKRGDLESFLAGAPGSPVVASKPVYAKTGRLPKAGSDAFWIELCRRFYSGEAGITGQTQDRLTSDMMDWMESNSPGLYAPDTVGDKIKAVWRALGISRR